ncbi:MAG: two component transcriptional regulator, LuxR family [Acidimicrobiales bacterium]|nr:two component transcriptional regulator, LuxR family [Acidimicrobiales bacterium]
MTEPAVVHAPSTRVLVADDHQLLRQALRRALEDNGLTVVGEAADGEEACRMAESLRPDIVVMDVTMPIMGGIEATKIVHDHLPNIRIVVLTMHDEHSLIVQAVDAGASAFLNKDCSLQQVVETVIQVADGDVLLSPEIAANMLGAMTPVGKESPLTKREDEILQAIADGSSTTEVARDLFISAKTVKNHLASIYEKLNARDRTQAVLSGVRIGIVQIR